MFYDIKKPWVSTLIPIHIPNTYQYKIKGRQIFCTFNSYLSHSMQSWELVAQRQLHLSIYLPTAKIKYLSIENDTTSSIRFQFNLLKRCIKPTTILQYYLSNKILHNRHCLDSFYQTATTSFPSDVVLSYRVLQATPSVWFLKG